MSFGNVDGIFTISLDVFATLAFCAIIALLSFKFAQKVKIIQKYCIPPVVIGGLIYSVIYSLLKASGIVNIVCDTSLYDTLFIIFFTTVGFGTVIDKKMMKLAGKLFIIMYIFEAVGDIGQNALAMLGGKVTGLPLPVAFLSGTATMYGGIPGGTAWGAKVEELGFTGATGIGIASGAIGQIMGGVIAAPVVKKLFIDRYSLKSTETPEMLPLVDTEKTEINNEFNLLNIIRQIAIFGIIIPVGVAFRTWIMDVTGFYVLDFVGCMIIAIILTNVDKACNGFFGLDRQFMKKFGDVVLNMFLTMSFLTLDLTELKDLIGGTAVICILQGIFIVLLCMIIFRVLGKTYDAAVLCAGYIGHGLGNMTTAFASMDTITDEYGSCRAAYIITPLIGACLIDLVDLPMLSITYNFAL